jgi:hypothetical protein
VIVDLVLPNTAYSYDCFCFRPIWTYIVVTELNNRQLIYSLLMLYLPINIHYQIGIYYIFTPLLNRDYIIYILIYRAAVIGHPLINTRTPHN